MDVYQGLFRRECTFQGAVDAWSIPSAIVLGSTAASKKSRILVIQVRNNKSTEYVQSVLLVAAPTRVKMIKRSIDKPGP